jgi:hypothetical protein
LFYNVAGNSTASLRTGLMTIAGLSFVVGQAANPAALRCTTPVATPTTARFQGRTEQVGDIVLTCSGSSDDLSIGKIRVSLNTPITSKMIEATGAMVDALLLLDDPAAPVIGTNAFLGTLLGPSLVEFAGVPLVGGGVTSRTFRITNLRGDASSLSAHSLAAVPVMADVSVIQQSIAPIAFTRLTVANVTSGLALFRGNPVSVGTQNQPQTNVTLTYREGFAGAFKPRMASNQDPSTLPVDNRTESGFVNTSMLGAQVGTASSGTRLLARIKNVPVNVRVFVPVYPNGNTNVQLVTQDNNGEGSGFVAGTPAFGGQYQEVVLSSGAGSATWEVIASDPFAIETLRFELVFLNATPADCNVVQTAEMLAPVGGGVPIQSVPQFRDLSVAQSLVDLRVRPTP